MTMCIARLILVSTIVISCRPAPCSDGGLIMAYRTGRLAGLFNYAGRLLHVSITIHTEHHSMTVTDELCYSLMFSIKARNPIAAEN